MWEQLLQQNYKNGKIRKIWKVNFKESDKKKATVNLFINRCDLYYNIHENKKNA